MPLRPSISRNSFSSSSLYIPEKTAFLLKRGTMLSSSSLNTVSSRLATRRSNLSSIWEGLASLHSTSRPFNLAFSSQDRTASRLMSIPRTLPAPSFLAATASIPLPVPTSRTESPSLRYSLIILKQSLVVGWSPVPKAIPGFMRRGIFQGGIITKSSTSTGPKPSFQSFQSSGTSSTLTGSKDLRGS